MKAHQSHQSRCSHNSHFTGADFFRRLVADRANSKLRDRSPFQIKSALSSMVAEISLGFVSINPAEVHSFWADQTEILIEIAALCERAAVDLTIPNSRAGRDRRSARSASTKGSKK
jgi:hypothetical protein